MEKKLRDWHSSAVKIHARLIYAAISRAHSESPCDHYHVKAIANFQRIFLENNCLN
jgi:hypothetical protein